LPDPLPRPLSPPHPVPLIDGSGPPHGFDHHLPFSGVTVLLVEDSRYAADAIRLLCHKSGARLRRAETLASARRHLRCYRPDVIIVDLGLPDGCGEYLLRELALISGRSILLLATSGDPGARAGALAAGAQGFLEKPITSLAGFQLALSPVRDAGGWARGGESLPGCGLVLDGAAKASAALPAPDPLALQDDLRHAASLAHALPDVRTCDYLRGFIAGLARTARDPDLVEAARLADDPASLVRLADLLTHRLCSEAAVFRCQ
jgi:CheY-like chemotaxis protein